MLSQWERRAFTRDGRLAFSRINRFTVLLWAALPILPILPEGKLWLRRVKNLLKSPGRVGGDNRAHLCFLGIHLRVSRSQKSHGWVLLFVKIWDQNSERG